ncbi:MAG: hypothetical protein WA913_06375, partial [Pricia sp.]
FKMAGFLLEINDLINARISLIDALKLDFKKLHLFQNEFPQYAETDWVLNIVSNVERALR